MWSEIAFSIVSSPLSVVGIFQKRGPQAKKNFPSSGGTVDGRNPPKIVAWEDCRSSVFFVSIRSNYRQYSKKGKSVLRTLQCVLLPFLMFSKNK